MKLEVPTDLFHDFAFLLLVIVIKVLLRNCNQLIHVLERKAKCFDDIVAVHSLGTLLGRLLGIHPGQAQDTSRD